MFDVVVVGAGPSGSGAARACAERGLSTLLLEEHATIGYPVQCAGLLSCSAFNECDVSPRPILHRVRGARVIPDGGAELVFDAKEMKAVVVDRGQLDREMAENAARAGVEVRLKTQVYGIENGALLTRGIRGRESVRYRMLIAADGPKGLISRRLGMQRPPVYLSGIQAEIPREMDGSLVELYPDASPDFFGWAIPAGEGRARVGLCGLDNVWERFSSFAKGFNGCCLHLVTGTIPLGVMPRTYGHRTLFVGDAAGFAKPTSGGGVYTGVRAARHAAEIAVRCCEQGRFDDDSLSEYERLWKDDFGKELATGFRLWELRRRMTPVQINELCRVLADPDLIETIIEYGDMDRPNRLLRRLAMKPALLRAMKGLVQSELKKIITG